MCSDDMMTDDLKKKIAEKVMSEVDQFELKRVERALKVLEETSKIAPAFAKACRGLDEALQREGFSPASSLAIIQQLVSARGLGL